MFTSMLLKNNFFSKQFNTMSNKIITNRAAFCICLLLFIPTTRHSTYKSALSFGCECHLQTITQKYHLYESINILMWLIFHPMSFSQLPMLSDLPTHEVKSQYFTKCPICIIISLSPSLLLLCYRLWFYLQTFALSTVFFSQFLVCAF